MSEWVNENELMYFEGRAKKERGNEGDLRRTKWNKNTLRGEKKHRPTMLQIQRACGGEAHTDRNNYAGRDEGQKKRIKHSSIPDPANRDKLYTRGNENGKVT